MDLMKCIKSISVREPFILVVKFATGERKEVSLRTLIEGNDVFSIFNDNEDYFKEVKIDKGGFGLYWDENLDVSADYLYDKGILICTCGNAPEYDDNEKAIFEIIVNSKIKVKAEEIMKTLGLDFNTAMVLFIYQVYYTKSIPFPVKLPDWLILESKKNIK